MLYRCIDDHAWDYFVSEKDRSLFLICQQNVMMVVSSLKDLDREGLEFIDDILCLRCG